MLWVIQLFLSGKRFPERDLLDIQWRQYVYDIVHFLSDDEVLSEILDFDSDVFYTIIAKLFKGKPWKYFSEMHKKVKERADVIEPLSLLLLFMKQGEKAKALNKSS